MRVSWFEIWLVKMRKSVQGQSNSILEPEFDTSHAKSWITLYNCMNNECE